MDLWDLTRLLFRRWYIALPILLASVLTTSLVGQSVKPDYRATGNVVMIPAPGPPATQTATPEPGEKSRPNNPWADLGLEALGNAAMLKVLEKDTLQSLAKAGLSEGITIQMAPRAPILYVEAVGTSPAQATATVREVIRLLVTKVAEQQRRFGVLPQDTITTLVLTDGADVETVTSKVKRVLIAIAGLGLLITAGGTIGLDMLLRRRRRVRRADSARPGGEFGAETVSRTSGERPPDVPEPTSPEEEAEVSRRLPVAREIAPRHRGQEQAGAGGERHHRVESKTGPLVDGIEYLVPPAKRSSASEDQTVILSPVRKGWVGSEDRKPGR